ncbi:unnamed protein product, partial [Laminaria digitata]
MCKALLEPPASSPSTPPPSADHGVRPGGAAAEAARAGAAAAAPAAPASNCEVDNNNAPRYRRPRSSCTCQASTAIAELQQQQCSSATVAGVGGSGLGESGCTGTERLPSVMGESGVPLDLPSSFSSGRSNQMVPPRPTCDLCPTRANVGLAGQQQQQQQPPSARSLP